MSINSDTILITKFKDKMKMKCTFGVLNQKQQTGNSFAANCVLNGD